MNLGPHDVIRVRHTTETDRYGDQQTDSDAPAVELPLVGCSVQPVVGQEYLDAREAAETRHTVWIPGLPDVTATDHITWGGHDYAVAGEPQRWEHPPIVHTVVTISRSEG